MNENTTDIWNVYKITHSMDARNALVESYLPLLRGTVRRMYPVCRSSWEAEDIYQCAALGLISAVESYEEGHGAAIRDLCLLPNAGCGAGLHAPRLPDPHPPLNGGQGPTTPLLPGRVVRGRGA
ncbi:MAG: sigma factor [Eubacteriales bacterium]